MRNRGYGKPQVPRWLGPSPPARPLQAAHQTPAEVLEAAARVHRRGYREQAQAGIRGRAQLGSKTIATEATNQDAQAMHGMSKQARKLTPVDRLAENPDNNAQRGGAQSGRRVGKATQEPAQRALNSDAHRQYLDERR